MQTSAPLNDRISANFEELSPKLRLAAEFVAKHPDEVATRSLRYVAGMTELTPPTFSRLAAALGYDAYEDLRDSCRDQIKKQRVNFADRADALQKHDSLNPEKGRFILRQGTSAIENINLLLNSMDLGLLETTAERLVAARSVILVGSMSSRPFVDYLAYVASMAFENWMVFGHGTGSTAATLVGTDNRDVAIVLSKSPCARDSIEAAKILNEQGVWIVAITDEVLSPLNTYCDASFNVSVETPQFFSSYVATLVLIESLIGIVIAMGGENVGRRIAAVESASHRIGEYHSRAAP